MISIRDIRVQERILQEADPNLSKVMEIVRSTEIAKKQTKEMSCESHEANTLQIRNRHVNYHKPLAGKHKERPRSSQKSK